MMGEEEACLNNKLKKKIQVKECDSGCDISNGDGTVDDRLQDINDRKVLGTSSETKTEDRKRAAEKETMDDHQQDINDLRVLGTRLGGTMKMTKDNHQQDINDQKVLGTRLGRTKKTTRDDHQHDINDPRELGTRLGGTKMLKERQEMNEGIQGEDGRDEMYKDEGAGLSGMVEGGGAGLGDAVKGEGVRRGQDTGDINATYSYPLVGPRPEEAPDIDDSTVVQCTGADGSLVHPLDVMDNPPYSQHQEDDEHDDEQDANHLGAGQGDERDYDQDAIDPGHEEGQEGHGQGLEICQN